MTVAHHTPTASAVGSTTSPCIGICSVTVGDAVCRGCFRTMDDIACWSQATPDEKARRLARRQTALESTFDEFFTLMDQQLLTAQWQKYIAQPPQPAFPAEAWMHLLQKGAYKIQNTEAYGIRLRPACTDQPLRTLWRAWRDRLMVQQQ
ncbi:MAG: DUF1289 domain-containing protein [Natronospirillum sp.]